MFKKLLTLLVALVAFATTAWAQTSSSTSNPIVLQITPFLACSATRGIDYGVHRRLDGPLFTSATNYAEWMCDTDPDNSINITFTLPSQMINASATSFPVPLTYGALSAFIDQNASQFNPSTGLGNDIVPTGHAVIRLGWPRNGTGADELIRADIASAKRGAYTATVTMNVTVN